MKKKIIIIWLFIFFFFASQEGVGGTSNEITRKSMSQSTVSVVIEEKVVTEADNVNLLPKTNEYTGAYCSYIGIILLISTSHLIKSRKSLSKMAN